MYVFVYYIEMIKKYWSDWKVVDKIKIGGIMSEYIPDKWQVVNLKIDELDIDKVMGSWYGGFLGSDNWRLSSGIVEVVEKDTYYEVHNQSGSVYMCHKKSQGMSAHTAQVFLDFEKQLKEQGGSLEVCDMANILDKYQHKS